jgi:hypothetical protein
MSSVIRMVDGTQFTVSEETEEVMREIEMARQGVSGGAAAFARFKQSIDDAPLYVNVEHVALVTEES